jgi:tight adherence protein C
MGFLIKVFLLALMLIPTQGMAIGLYDDMTPNELYQIHKAACDAGSMSNCLETGYLLEDVNNTNRELRNRALAREYFQRACQGGERKACEHLNPPEETGSMILYYAAILLIGLSVFIVTMMIFQEEDQFQAVEKLEDGSSGKDQLVDHGVVLKYSRPFFRRYVVPIVASMKNKKSIKEKYKRKLASAGLTETLTPEDFFSFKLFLIIGFPIVFVGVRAFLEEDWPLKLIPLIAFVGYFYPDIWVRGKIQARQKEIISNMPFAVDMLALSVEAGLDFMAAITKVVDKAKPSALREEFEILLKEIRIGASRAEALRNMAWRVDLINISSFCATLIAADSVGASIGPILKALSAEIRQKRSSDIEKAGATAATKILFPMLFLIVPAVFIIVAAPIMLELITG